MRSLAVALVLIGIFGLSVSSFARDVSIGKHTTEEVKSVCDKVGEEIQATQTDVCFVPIADIAPIRSLRWRWRVASVALRG
jgi:hypothetical protein